MPHDLNDRIHAGDRTLFTLFGSNISLNEWHSLVCGTCLGALFGTQPTLYGTVQREPWYFLISVVVGYILGRKLSWSAHS